MRLTIGIGLMVMIVLAYSCENVINIPLNEADRKIVVEADLCDLPGLSYVLLSKTGSVYDDSTFYSLSGASVTVTDLSGTSFVFMEDSLVPGLYLCPGFVVQPENHYDLLVEVEGKTISSSSASFSKPNLTDITFDPQVVYFGSYAGDTAWIPYYHLSDNGAEQNYYKIRMVKNGKPRRRFMLTDDKLFNGSNFSGAIYTNSVKHGDTISIELMSTDEANFNYFETFENADGDAGGPFSAAPANPVSNIVGDAIGYFGVPLPTP